MRIGEHVAWVPSVGSSAFTAYEVGWLAGLVVLLVTFVIGDIYRAGGFSKWATKLVPVFEKWDEQWTSHVKRKGDREVEKLRLDQRLTKLKRGR